MLTPTGFPSWRNYFQFALAREFVTTDENQPYVYERNWMETVGQNISRPLVNPVNFLLREIKNPLVILALTVSAIAVVSLVFYPAQFLGVVYTVLPFLSKVQPWMVKAALFVGVEATIAAIGLRAFGRMCNQDLRRAWHANEIRALQIGDRVRDQ